MYKKNIIGSVAFIFLFAAAFFMSGSFPAMVDIYPKIICVMGIILSACLLGQTVYQKKHNIENEKKLSRKQIITIAVTLAGTLVYVMLIPVVGYMTMTFIFLLTMTFYVDPTSPKIAYPLVGIAFIVLLYLAFGVFLKIPLPKGILI